MLINKCLPVYQFSEHHSIVIKGSKDQVYSHLLQADLRKGIMIKILLRLGGLPDDVYVIEDLAGKMGFVKLAEHIGDEVVFGIVTNSPTFRSCSSNISSTDFFREPNPHLIKAVINFRVTEKNTLNQMVSTETRVWCANKSIRKRFGYYWFFIKPFSQMLRKEVLKELKKSFSQSHK